MTVPLSNESDYEILDEINKSCQCISIDPANIKEKISSHNQSDVLLKQLTAREFLFATIPVFISQNDVEAINEIIEAIETVTKHNEYRKIIQKRIGERLKLPDIPCSAGVFMGYDFHLSDSGPKLIEINTNAGGAFLVEGLVNSLNGITPCGDLPFIFGAKSQKNKIIKTFIDEWQLDGRRGEPACIAITDDNPRDQFLYPDMLLAQKRLEQHGINAIIVNAPDFSIQNNELIANGQPIDFVYNRLTDFQLSNPRYSALRWAYQNNAAVISPAPHHHALYADKRNLSVLGNEPLLKEWGVKQKYIETLKKVPSTNVVTPDNLEKMWSSRKRLFFKPADGFGSKAVYRGDKITKNAWNTVKKGNYVAQETISPSQRSVLKSQKDAMYKFDIRVFVYRGKILSMAARIYNGQTTNFRTPGGGFAPVIVFPHAESMTLENGLCV